MSALNAANKPGASFDRGRVLAPGEPHGKLYVALVGALEAGLIELVPGSAPEGRYRVPVA